MTAPSKPELRRTIRVSGLAIPAALTLPSEDGAASLVLLVPGSLFSDVDGNYPSWDIYPRTYAYLAEQLAARGHAVYRFAKVGPGTGTEIEDEDAYKAVRSFDGRRVIAAAALEDARRALDEAGIETKRTVLAGHSEGAVVVSRLAPEVEALDGVVLLSGPSVGLLSIMREQVAAHLEPAGRLEELALVDDAYDRVRRGDEVPEDWAEKSETIRMLLAHGQKGFWYLREVDAFDPSAAAARIAQPVLIVQGGSDASVHPHHADRLAAARGDRPTEVARFPGLQHMYKPLPEGMGAQEAFGLDGPTDPVVTDAIDTWIRQLGT